MQCHFDIRAADQTDHLHFRIALRTRQGRQQAGQELGAHRSIHPQPAAPQRAVHVHRRPPVLGGDLHPKSRQGFEVGRHRALGQGAFGGQLDWGVRKGCDGGEEPEAEARLPARYRATARPRPSCAARDFHGVLPELDFAAECCNGSEGRRAVVGLGKALDAGGSCCEEGGREEALRN